MLDKNVVVVCKLSGNNITRKVILIPDGSFLEDEALLKKFKALVNYFDSLKRK